MLSRGTDLVAIEVKGGTRQRPVPGITAFCKEYDVKRKLLVGGDGIPLADFLLTPPLQWLD